MRLAPAAQAFSGAVTPPQIVDDRSFLRATEDVIRERCAAGSGVILGRAAAVVLRTGPARCTCASTGRPTAGWAQAMELDGIDLESAERHCARPIAPARPTSSSSTRVDARGRPALPLVIDSTALASNACVELIALAAAARSDRVG